MKGSEIGDMMGGLSELGMIVIAGFLFVFLVIPVFNWLSNKVRGKKK